LKKSLHIIPFESLYPPLNGGMQRCFNILLQLSKYTHLTVITFLDIEQISIMKLNHPELSNVKFITAKKIPNQIELSLFQRVRNAIFTRYINADIFKKSNSNLLRVYFTLRAELINNEFDLVIIEQIDLIRLGKYYRKKIKKIIFNAHNFDTEIYFEMYEHKEITKREYLNVKLIETKLYRNIDILWTCSERDASLFRKVNKRNISQIDVVPNGTRIPLDARKNNVNLTDCKLQQPIILFVGSLDYKPNVAGLIWFIENVLSEIRFEFEFRIIGSGLLSEKLKKIIVNSERVRFLGFVENLENDYNVADLVVIPILSGSGTRLKALEAMSYGCTIVSTLKGVEGIDINNEVIIENDPVLMAKAIRKLIENPSYCREIGDKARTLAEKTFDWNIIGQKINQSIERSFQTEYKK
jgi:glycosyltransferase involved in cell wall biosynthesis